MEGYHSRYQRAKIQNILRVSVNEPVDDNLATWYEYTLLTLVHFALSLAAKKFKVRAPAHRAFTWRNEIQN